MSGNSIPGLIADIELGKQSLDRILQHQVEVLERADVEPPFFLVSAASVVLHDFYNTIEKTFQQIAQEIDGGAPTGDAWHQQLLGRMTIEITGRRPPVIDKPLADTLSQYLRFRHLFRHIYGFELVWERIAPLIEAMPQVYEDFIKQIDAFIAFLQTVHAR